MGLAAAGHRESNDLQLNIVELVKSHRWVFPPQDSEHPEYDILSWFNPLYPLQPENIHTNNISHSLCTPRIRGFGYRYGFVMFIIWPFGILRKLPPDGGSEFS